LYCKVLIKYYIDPTTCMACMICFKKCPAGAIDGEKKKIHIIDQDKCTNCGTCFEVCPAKFSAVKKISGEPLPSPVPEEERMITSRSN
jgi:Na+-translocating ferredoxin:NAD+ oxidoreductase RNF subunit RnfB